MPRLGPREEQIVNLLLNGADNGEIAKELGISRRTVKEYMSRMFKRYEIKDGIKRVKLAVLLFRRRHGEQSAGEQKPSDLDDGYHL